MFFCVLIEFHPMVGVDFHKELAIIPPAPAPVPVPFAPHLTGATLNWVLPAATANTVRATWAHARIMQRGTDIQSFVPHIPLAPPAVLLAGVLTIFSGSKSYFGPASVQANGAPIAIAIQIIANLNLQCGDIPTPTGRVIAPNTVVAGMTWGDFWGGLFQMATEAALQAALNKALGPFGDIGGNVVGLFIGTPLGFSFNSNGTGPIGSVGRLAGQLGNLARSLGEDLGGDHAQATQDRKDIGKALADEGKHTDYSDWNIFGSGDGSAPPRNGPLGIGRTDKEGDGRRLIGSPGILHGIGGALGDAFGSPATPPTQSFSGADNPNAEQF